MKKIVFGLFFFPVCLTATAAMAFQFSEPSHGAVFVAGSTVEIRIDTGEIPPLFGVLFTTSRGIVKSKVDTLAPFKWSVKIPEDFYGPLTLWAIGRRYYPIPNPPRASVTIVVVFPAISLSGSANQFSW